MTVISFENLARRYGAHWALENASGSLLAGEIAALQGENGSGKSTLLLALAGILKPQRGKITSGDGARTHLVAHHAMAYTALSIARNLELAAAVEDRATADIQAVAEYWQLTSLAAKPLATLSRGQMQRFLLARAMLSQPKILLLDEPFTGLDANGEKTLARFMHEEARRGTAILFSDHDAVRAGALAGRFIRMEAGRCIP